MHFPLRILSLLLISLLTLNSCTSMKPAPLKTVSHVDLGTLDRYALRPDGKMDNIFLFRRGSLDAPLEQWKGVARVHNKSTNAEWRVQFIWPLRVPYLIIDLDKDYEWSVIGYPSRKLAWVLSRKPVIDEATYRGILERMAKQGYDTRLLAKVPQRTK